MQPYFLAYVRDDGEVRYNFTHAKQALEMFSQLAAGHAEPFDAMCTLFNKETCEGSDMARYDGLVQEAVAEIKGRFSQRNLRQGLQGGRDGKLIAQTRQVENADSFDLITWLVIKGEP